MEYEIQAQKKCYKLWASKSLEWARRLEHIIDVYESSIRAVPLSFG